MAPWMYLYSVLSYLMIGGSMLVIAAILVTLLTPTPSLKQHRQ